MSEATPIRNSLSAIIFLFWFFGVYTLFLAPIVSLLPENSLGLTLSMIIGLCFLVVMLGFTIGICKGGHNKLKSKDPHVYQAIVSFIGISIFFLVRGYFFVNELFIAGTATEMIFMLQPFVPVIATTAMTFVFLNFEKAKQNDGRLALLTSAFITIPSVVLLADYYLVVALAGPVLIFLLSWYGTYFMLTKGRKYIV